MKYYSHIVSGILVLAIALLIPACDIESMKKVPDEKFIGNWELSGRSMLEGIKVSINRTDDGKLVGIVSEINDDKYVKLFLEPGDKLVGSIKRSSNFEFKLTEKKIGSVLFSTYGLSSSAEFKVSFVDDNTIDLGSNIFYKRIQ